MSVYLDCNATTPLEPAVARIVQRFHEQDFGNPASPIHDYGEFARSAVDHARAQIARVVAAQRDEVIFTSGATEANNLAILGLESAGMRRGCRHIITTAVEHKAVLEPFALLQQRGFEVEVVPVDAHGRFDPRAIAAALRPDTLLVSTMQVNNETGVYQPLDAVGGILAQHDLWWHVDAAQGFGKELESLRHKRIDMLSISGHKIYAPKGIGALVMRKRNGRFPPLTPLIYGGGQEQGLRAGTLPVALIAGLGEAAKLALRQYESRRNACLDIRRTALDALMPLGVQQNGAEAFTLPHTINVSLPGIRSDQAIKALKDVVAISSTSA
ncbi:MAG: aminotransferase class V-fold PLP-dependent enzyme, partial [Geobacteraceae bacterium]|nr:aminotransferase class V-fold PLP-dependent enzyme [Geobacteraceae bacterium]